MLRTVVSVAGGSVPANIEPPPIVRCVGVRLVWLKYNTFLVDKVVKPCYNTHIDTKEHTMVEAFIFLALFFAIKVWILVKFF